MTPLMLLLDSAGVMHSVQHVTGLISVLEAVLFPFCPPKLTALAVVARLSHPAKFNWVQVNLLFSLFSPSLVVPRRCCDLF